MRILILIATLFSSLAVADGWRVGTDLILPGDTMPEVREAAGTPDVDNRIESPEGGTIGRRWYYHFEGYNARTVIITFRAGRVVRVEVVPG